MIHHTPSTVFCQGLLFSTVFIQCTVLFVSICLQLTSSFFQMQLSKYSGYFKNHQGTYYKELTSHSSHSSTHLRYGISRIHQIHQPSDASPKKQNITGHLWVKRKNQKQITPKLTILTHCISGLVGFKFQPIWSNMSQIWEFFPQLRGEKS